MSWLYSHRIVYGVLMRVLYGRHLSARLAAVAAEVPAGCHVIDVCSGDGRLYREHLRHKPVRYEALDLSPQMVGWMSEHGINARTFDVRSEALPSADVIVMLSSLYQFQPDAASVVERMVEAARMRVIITEPIRNLSESRNPMLRFVARRLTETRSDAFGQDIRRFDWVTFPRLCQSFPTFERLDTLPGGREMIAVLGGRAAARHP
jgi:SAM-dependent methyltransferase